jgi:hypothetical protein
MEENLLKVGRCDFAETEFGTGSWAAHGKAACFVNSLGEL